MSFTNCYCYKNECRNNIFSGNKLYNHFFKKSQQKNLRLAVSGRKPVFTRGLSQMSSSPFLKSYPHGSRNSEFCLCYHGPTKVSLFIALKWQHSYPWQKNDELKNSTILVHMWSFPIWRDTATYFFTKWKSLFTMLQSICTWSSVTTRKTKRNPLLLKTKVMILLCYNTLLCFSKFYTRTKLLIVS